MKSCRILIGIALIIVGVIAGLNSLEITDINIFFSGWWTLFIIIPSLIGLFDPKDDNKTTSLIGIFVGLLLFLVCQDVISFKFFMKLFIPFIIVLLGVLIIIGDKDSEKITQKFAENKQKGEKISAIFAENSISKEDEDFEAGNLECLFGSINLDLRKATLSKETFIKVSNILGSTTIFVPADVTVKVKSNTILGEVGNKNNKGKTDKIIYLDAFCILGDIKIK